MAFFTYIVASRRNGTVYTGSTDDLFRRYEQHATGALGGFTAKHGCKLLIWFEVHEWRHGAFTRERSIKEWRRSHKLMLIERMNPTWEDLGPWLDRLLL